MEIKDFNKNISKITSNLLNINEGVRSNRFRGNKKLSKIVEEMNNSDAEFTDEDKNLILGDTSDGWKAPEIEDEPTIGADGSDNVGRSYTKRADQFNKQQTDHAKKYQSGCTIVSESIKTYRPHKTKF